MSNTGNELPWAIDFCFRKLTNPPITTIDGHVYEHPGPADSPARAITMTVQAATDLTVIGEERVWASALMAVTARDQTESTWSLKDVADEIDARLHGTDAVLDGLMAVISSTRVDPIQIAELVDGVPYRRLGGLYELLIQPANP